MDTKLPFVIALLSKHSDFIIPSAKSFLSQKDISIFDTPRGTDLSSLGYYICWVDYFHSLGIGVEIDCLFYLRVITINDHFLSVMAPTSGNNHLHHQNLHNNNNNNNHNIHNQLHHIGGNQHVAMLNNNNMNHHNHHQQNHHHHRLQHHPLDHNPNNPAIHGNNNNEGGEKTRHRSAYSTKRKYAIVQELTEGATKTQVLAKYPSLQRRTLDNWIRRKDEIIQAQESGLRSKKKRNFNDPLKRVKERVMDFLNTNEQLNEADKMNLTGEMIGVKAKMIADELLQQQSRQPFLNAAELEGLTKFTGSGAWGRKFCRDIRYRTANAPPLDSDEESTTELANLVDLATGGMEGHAMMGGGDGGGVGNSHSGPLIHHHHHSQQQQHNQDPDILRRGEVKAKHIASFMKAAEKFVDVMNRDLDFFEEGEVLKDYLRRLDRKKRRVNDEMKNKSIPRFSTLQQLDYNSSMMVFFSSPPGTTTTGPTTTATTTTRTTSPTTNMPPNLLGVDPQQQQQQQQQGGPPGGVMVGGGGVMMGISPNETSFSPPSPDVLPTRYQM